MKKTPHSAPIALRRVRPRNPLVAIARLRRAGSHRPSGAARRQQMRRALRHELAQWHPPQP